MSAEKRSSNIVSRRPHPPLPTQSVEKLLTEIGEERKKEMGQGKYADLTISEAVDTLRREGFNISPQKLRQYETQGLLTPLRKEESKYRQYSGSDLLIIRRVLVLIMVGFSIKKIKRYIALEGEFTKESLAYIKIMQARKDKTTKYSLARNRGEENRLYRVYGVFLEMSRSQREIQQRICENIEILSRKGIWKFMDIDDVLTKIRDELGVE